MQSSNCHNVGTITGPLSLEECKKAVDHYGANTFNYYDHITDGPHGVCQARLCHADGDLTLVPSDLNYLVYTKVHCKSMNGKL